MLLNQCGPWQAPGSDCVAPVAVLHPASKLTSQFVALDTFGMRVAIAQVARTCVKLSLAFDTFRVELLL